MESVGFLGIIKLTTQIILKNFKHFLCIAVLCMIPYAFFKLPVLDLSSFALDALVGSLISFYTIIVSREQFATLANNTALPPNNNTALPPNIYNTTDAAFPTLSYTTDAASVFLDMARLFCSIIIPLVSHPLIAFSVCRACLNKSLSLKGSFLCVTRSAKNLGLTAMCIGMVVFGFVAMTVGIFAIIMGVVVAVRGNELVTVSIIGGCTLSVMGIVGLYVAISFSLAHTVAILEEKRGWQAIRRSLDLVNGRKWVALGLVGFFYGIYEICKFCVSWRWRGAGIVRVSLKVLMALLSMAAHVVLYVSCKTRREEPLHTLNIVAKAQFGGPQESSPYESMDVETAAFLSSLPN